MRQTFTFGTFALTAGLLFCGVVHAAVPQDMTGTIKIDGSSTVYPITEAVAEEFATTHRRVKVMVGISGTGGGFQKFTAGEIDISNASRPIKASEQEIASKTGVEYIELPVAYDALTIVVNPKNSWVKSITVAELKKIWEPEAQQKITRWNQIRSDWPNAPIQLYGPGVDSGTYDYFTEAVIGKEDASRGDYTSSEDDNVLVQGVSRDENALGFFGLAYYEENKDKLRVVPVDDEDMANGSGAVMPTSETVINGSYQPLSRPLFIYVRKAATERPEVREFISFYLKNAPDLSAEVGYVPLTSTVRELAIKRFENRVPGTIFGTHGSQVGITLEKLLM